MKFLSVSWVARALGQQAASDSLLTQISSDTREVKPGALFVALVGENTDGHKYVEQARAAGATALVHNKLFPCPDGMVSFPVDDTLHAWRMLAGAWRKEFRIPVIVVAGSAGKTTSKEMLAALLRGRFKNVLQTLASQNGFQGVPTTLLRLRPEHDAAVIEVGIDEPDSMIQHLELVQPDAGLLSSIGPEHLEKLIDLDTVEEEEGMLFTVLEARRGLAAVNLDDERIARQAEQLEKARVLTYSLGGKASIQGRLRGELLHVDGLGEFAVPLEGTHNARNLLGALTLARGLGLSGDEMRAGLAGFVAPPGRSEVHSWHGCRVLADTYNANPASVVAALETLGAGRSWVCLGDMLELGTFEEQMHRGLADALLKHDVKNVLLYGPRMKNLEDELGRRGFGGVLKHFSEHEAMAAFLAAEAKAGDCILIKGSRGMKMEKVWESLRGK